jgi:hypothetical protein
MGNGCIDLGAGRMHGRAEFSSPASGGPDAMDDAGPARRISGRRASDRFMVEVF